MYYLGAEVALGVKARAVTCYVVERERERESRQARTHREIG